MAPGHDDIWSAIRKKDAKALAGLIKAGADVNESGAVCIHILVSTIQLARTLMS